MGRAITFYRTPSGNCPVEDFFDGLPAAVVRKITWVLRIVEEENLVPAQYFKKLKDTEELWECRINYGSSTYRVLCFFAPCNRLVLTHGFMKKTQKTPQREIARAETYRKDTLSRRHENE